jgi:hypothetical protein
VTQPSDLRWSLLSIVVLGIAYINVWKHGVPHVFEGGDISVSWNVWALTWSQGQFPTGSLGYPQFVPTIWAMTYIFTGSPEQYFAFYIYIVWLVIPITLNAMNLGRIGWWPSLVSGLVFVWFVAEIQEPWLRSSLEAAYPDWVATIFAFCGVVLFIAGAQQQRFDREKIVTAFISLGLVSIAAATKPLYGLFALAILIGICADATRHLGPRERNRFILVAVSILSLFVLAYALNYFHLAARSLPHYAVSELSDRLSRAAHLINSNFSIPFRVLVFAGLVLAPFLPRIRWLALPLWIGFWLWADTASYDLRNLLGLLLISAFIPVHAVTRRFLGTSVARTKTSVARTELRWVVSDGAVILLLAGLVVGMTLGVAQSDDRLNARFANDQLRVPPGIELHQGIAQLLARGCTVFSADAFPLTISALQPYRDRIQFFFFTEPLNDALADRFNKTSGCVGVYYPPDRTHPSMLRFIADYAASRHLEKIVETNGMALLASSP